MTTPNIMPAVYIFNVRDGSNPILDSRHQDVLGGETFFRLLAGAYTLILSTDLPQRIYLSVMQRGGSWKNIKSVEPKEGWRNAMVDVATDDFINIRITMSPLPTAADVADRRQVAVQVIPKPLAGT